MKAWRSHVQNLMRFLAMVFMMFLFTSCISLECTSCENKTPKQDPTVDPIWSCKADPGFPGPGQQCWGTSWNPPGGYYHKKGCNNTPTKWCENMNVGTSNASCDCVTF